MTEETQNTFDDIKPFIRMLEGSIDKARAKRLREEQPQTESDNGRGMRVPGSMNPTKEAAHRSESLGSAPNAAQMSADGSSPWGSNSQANSTNGFSSSNGNTPTNGSDRRAQRLASPKYQWK